MSTYYLRDTTENPNIFKRILGFLLPLALKRHLLYFKHYRRIGNFRNPRLFSEKMQWRIINDRREILRYTCDKRASARRALEVATREGITLRHPRQVVWSSDVLDLMANLRSLHERGELPERWVLKPNHSSGRALAVNGEPDWAIVEHAARRWMTTSRFESLHWIWPYVVANKGLVVEEFVPGEYPPLEWQLWMFGGATTFVVVQRREQGQLYRSIFDAAWNPVVSFYNQNAEPLDIRLPPANWRQVEQVAHSLCRSWDMVRVDLYQDLRGHLWFGELTPFPLEGLIGNVEGRDEVDCRAGAAWSLPNLRKDETSD